MSYSATGAVWAARRSGSLKGGSTLLVALALADRADSRTGEVRTGVRRLAADTGLSRSTTGRAMKTLRDVGALVVTEPSRGTRPARSRLAYYQGDANGKSERAVDGTLKGVDNSGERPTNGTQANPLRPILGPLRPTRGDACVPLLRDKTSTRRIPGREPVVETTAPSDVPEYVAQARRGLVQSRNEHPSGTSG